MAQRIKKVVIFAGGKGTRLGDVTKVTPKPLINIGPDPIIVHIMRHFYNAGYKEFIIATGHLSDEFKKYFRDYGFKNRNVIFTKYGHHIEDNDDAEDWKITIVETGKESSTGQRLAFVKKYLDENEPFFLTYGDTVSDVDLDEVETKHLESDNIITLTLARKYERFGVVEVDGKGKVKAFREKNESDASFINGGFIACDYSLFDEVNENTGDFSFEILSKLPEKDKVGYHVHEGFWSPMDTKQDYDKLNELYENNSNLFQ